MARDFKTTCMQYIFALGWSDGALAAVEREFLAQLLHRADLSNADYLEAVQWLDGAPPEPNWAELRQHPQIARDVLKQAVLLSMLDMSVSASEMALLDRLRQQIGMEERELWRIQQEVERLIMEQRS